MSNSIGFHTAIRAPKDVSLAIVPSNYLEVAAPLRFRRTKDIHEDFNDELEKLIYFDGIMSTKKLLEDIWSNGGRFQWHEGLIKQKIFTYRQAEFSPKLYYLRRDNQERIEVPENSVVARAKNDETRDEYFFVFGSQQQGFAENLFTINRDAYNDAWKSSVDWIIRAYPDGQEIASESEYIDLSLSAIVERFAFLDGRRASTKLFIDNLNQKLTDAAEFKSAQALYEAISELQTAQASIRTDIRLLEARASEQGMILITEDGFTLTRSHQGTPQPFNAAKGALYQKETYVTTWVETHYVTRTRRSWFRKKTWQEAVHVTRTARDTDYREVSISVSAVDDFVKKNLAEFDTVKFNQTSVGLISDDGRHISDVMRLCELDRSFQRRAAILLPVYNQDLYGTDVPMGYHVIKRPQRGRRIMAPPTLYIEERYAYKLRWLGCELGELTSSVNLMPGEERTISVKSVQSSVTENEINSKSLTDVDRSTSFDTLSSIENEFQKENRSESRKSWSVKASGSYGPFSASGSTGGSSVKSARQFSRDLNKLTTQAISKMRRSTKQEIVTRELTREEASLTSDSSGVVGNPNIGHTLNVNFFRVNNLYATGNYLEDVEVVYESPVELVDGTGIRELYSFGRGEFRNFVKMIGDDLFNHIMNSQTIFDEDGHDQAEDLANDEVQKYKLSILRNIVQEMTDYLAPIDGAPSGERAPVPAFDVTDVADPAGLPDDVDQLISWIERLSATEAPIEPSLISAPSAALYADSLIGNTEGLESFASRMRKLEIEEKLASIIEKYNPSNLDDEIGSEIYQNLIHNFIDGQRISITLASSIQHGHWSLFVAGQSLGIINVESDDLTYELGLPEGFVAHEWMNEARSFLVKV